MFPLYSALIPSLIVPFDVQKTDCAHHSVLRAIIRWFMDRSDNGEWCALLTYKIGKKITILSQQAHFLVIQSSGKGFVGLVCGWIADY